MYRVELKEILGLGDKSAGSFFQFLMYRVELKEGFLDTLQNSPTSFLMYRVELKAKNTLLSFSSLTVPNVPCGVERNNP